MTPLGKLQGLPSQTTLWGEVVLAVLALLVDLVSLLGRFCQMRVAVLAVLAARQVVLVVLPVVEGVLSIQERLGTAQPSAYQDGTGPEHLRTSSQAALGVARVEVILLATLVAVVAVAPRRCSQQNR